MTALTIVLGGCTMCLVLYCGWVLWAAWHLARKKTVDRLSGQPPFVSVVVPARNEALQIEVCLESLRAQSYPGDRYEVLCADDHSEDDTAQKVLALRADFPQLKLLRLGPGQEGKKAAISAAVAAAAGTIILQIDADCLAPPHWINRMLAPFGDSHCALVSGPVRLTPGPGVFERLQALESAALVALGGGSMLGGFPNMANGANMAYRRSAFVALDGFSGVDAVASGDDELLLQKFKRAGLKMTFLADPEAVVETSTLSQWEDFRQQRLRWVSKSRAYLDRRVNVLQLISFLGFCAFPLALIYGAAEGGWNWLLLLLLFKTLCDLPLLSLATHLVRRRVWLRWLPLLELVYIPYVLWIGVAGNLVKRYSWKNRSVR